MSEEYSVASSRSDLPAPADRGLTTKQKAAEAERATLAKQESQAIKCLRWIVFLVLLIIGAAIAGLIFHFVREEQVDQFEEDFKYYATQVTETFNKQLRRTLDAQDTLSTDITSHAVDTESSFPFITLPEFEFKGANARIAGDTTLIYYMPAVTEEIRLQWEKYAAEHKDHNEIAFASEQISKAEQDMSFGLETPEYSGLALNLVINPGTTNTSSI